MPFLTIIVPIYNGESYIGKCIDSILEQTFRDFELILVNDGSTDNSKEVCKEYQQKDSRVITISKKRGGVASARQVGLDHASGKFVTFVDSDDWIENNMYEVLYDLQYKYDADIVVCNYIKDYGDHIEVMNNILPIPQDAFNGEELVKLGFLRDMYRGVAAFLWNKVFRKEILEGITIHTDLKRGDDVAFFTDSALACKRAAYTNKALYHYVQRDTSITHRRNLDNIDVLSDILKGYEIAINKMECFGISEDILIWPKRFFVYHASQLAQIALENDDKVRCEYFREQIKKYLEEYLVGNSQYPDRIKYIQNILLQIKEMIDI